MRTNWLLTLLRERRPGTVLALSLLLLGCGGGGGSGPVSNCSLDTFTPNYAHSVDHLFNWAAFPVKVYFVRDAQFTNDRRLIALAGFDQWVTATGGKLTYTEVAGQDTAQIVVTFDPTTANGLTTSHFSGLTMTHADMSLGVKDQAPSDLQCVGAHEFGHALGIDGHSPNSADLMYAIHYVGHPCAVTTSDRNTMETGYCHLFGRCVAVGTAGTYNGPPGVVTRH